MYQLYLDTTNKKLTIVILHNNRILTSACFDAWQKQTELALVTINNLLAESGIGLRMINQIFVVNGPGSYTGIRVGLTFIKTLKVLNPTLAIFVINSLLLQVGLQKAISILPAYNGKSYLAVYNQTKVIIPPQLIDENAKRGIISDLADFIVIENFKDVDVIGNFQLLAPYFTEIKNITQLQPYYLNDPFLHSKLD